MDKSGGTIDALDDGEYSGSVISLIENGEEIQSSRMKMEKKSSPRGCTEQTWVYGAKGQRI